MQYIVIFPFSERNMGKEKGGKGREGRERERKEIY
jgi:hypothetical protein